MAGDDELRFEPAPAPTRAEVEALVQRVYVRVMKWLARRGFLRGDASNAPPSQSPRDWRSGAIPGPSAIGLNHSPRTLAHACAYGPSIASFSVAPVFGPVE